MGKCIFNQLKEMVSDSSLSYLNSLHFVVNSKSGAHYRLIVDTNYNMLWSENKFISVKVIGGYVYDSSNNPHTEIHGKTALRIEPISTEPMTVIIGNADKLVQFLPGIWNLDTNADGKADVDYSIEIHSRELEGNKIIKRITSPLQGDIEMLNLSEQLIDFPSNGNAYGDMATLPCNIETITAYLKVTGRLRHFNYSSENVRSNSNCHIINISYPTLFLVSVEDVENYLIASAKCYTTGTYKETFYMPKDYVAPQKVKEACWYLTHKMYKTKGATERTDGWKALTIKGIDFSDITQDPGWEK